MVSLKKLELNIEKKVYMSIKNYRDSISDKLVVKIFNYQIKSRELQIFREYFRFHCNMRQTYRKCDKKRWIISFLFSLNCLK